MGVWYLCAYQQVAPTSSSFIIYPLFILLLPRPGWAYPSPLTSSTADNAYNNPSQGWYFVGRSSSVEGYGAVVSSRSLSFFQGWYAIISFNTSLLSLTPPPKPMSDCPPSLCIIRLYGIGPWRKLIVLNLLQDRSDSSPAIRCIRGKGGGGSYYHADRI